MLVSLCIYNGLLLYATFHDCDPLTTKVAKAKDQLLPLLVMQVLEKISGLPGLFIAGLFSGNTRKKIFDSFSTIFCSTASLSSVSSALSSLSAVVLKDYFKPCFRKELSNKACELIMRLTVVILGCLIVALVYVIEQLGSVLQLSMIVPGTCVGSLFGIFIFGMFLAVELRFMEHF